MKHVGKMKNNSTRVAIVYRTLPGDPNSALVVAPGGLRDMYHDNLMSVIEHDSGQQANELADVLAVRKFPDGINMLEYMHVNGHLKKVPTHLVIMTPDNKTSIALDELNKMVAEQKGVDIEDLAISEGSAKSKKEKKAKAAEAAKSAEILTTDLTASEMRSKADALYKEAAQLRKDADALDPPKKKATKEKTVA